MTTFQSWPVQTHSVLMRRWLLVKAAETNDSTDTPLFSITRCRYYSKQYTTFNKQTIQTWNQNTNIIKTAITALQGTKHYTALRLISSFTIKNTVPLYKLNYFGNTQDSLYELNNIFALFVTVNPTSLSLFLTVCTTSLLLYKRQQSFCACFVNIKVHNKRQASFIL